MNKEPFSPSVRDLAQSLVDALQMEEISIKQLEKHLDGQLAALRSQERGILEDLTIDTSNEVSKLHNLQSNKQEHIQHLCEHLTPGASKASLDSLINTLDESFDDSLIESLKLLQQRIPEQAKTIREKSKELAYSLQYALHLGHQMIEAIQGATSSPPMLIYTAAGSKKISANKRMMVNKVG